MTTSHDIAERVSLTPRQFEDVEARVDDPLLPVEGWGDAVLIWNGIVARFPVLVLPPTSARNIRPRT
jgi:hypothetical protein